MQINTTTTGQPMHAGSWVSVHAVKLLPQGRILKDARERPYNAERLKMAKQRNRLILSRNIVLYNVYTASKGQFASMTIQS